MRNTASVDPLDEPVLWWHSRRMVPDGSGADTRPRAWHAEAGHGAEAAALVQRDLPDPPHTGEETDENTRVTQAVVTNPNLEIKGTG